MPELPEVETSVQAIQKFKNQNIESIEIFNPNLRWKVNTQDFQQLVHWLTASARARVRLIFVHPRIALHLPGGRLRRLVDAFL